MKKMNLLRLVGLIIFVVLVVFIYLYVFLREWQYGFQHIYDTYHDEKDWIYKLILSLLTFSIVLLNFINTKFRIWTINISFNLYFLAISLLLIIYNVILIGQPIRAVLSIFYIILIGFLSNKIQKKGKFLYLKIVLFFLLFPSIIYLTESPQIDSYPPLPCEYNTYAYIRVAPLPLSIFSLFYSKEYSYSKSHYISFSRYKYNGFNRFKLITKSLMYNYSLWSIIVSLAMIVWSLKTTFLKPKMQN